MIFEHEHYRGFLKESLAARVMKNPSFSLRAFARQLKVAPSFLSSVLKGTKNLSPETAILFARHLGLDPRESEYFSLLVMRETARNPGIKAELDGRIRSVASSSRPTDLSLDAFKMIADWYHLPILMMTCLEGVELTARVAAERLGISEIEADVAIERLERLELLMRDGRGRLVREKDSWLARAAHPSPALRRFHRQMLEKAIDSLESQAPDEKFVGSETFAMDPALLGKAEGILDKALAEVSALSKASGKRSHVYHLGAQLFRVTARPASPPPAKKNPKPKPPTNLKSKERKSK